MSNNISIGNENEITKKTSIESDKINDFEKGVEQAKKEQAKKEQAKVEQVQGGISMAEMSLILALMIGMVGCALSLLSDKRDNEYIQESDDLNLKVYQEVYKDE